jgi:hypothetical protein
MADVVAVLHILKAETTQPLIKLFPASAFNSAECDRIAELVETQIQTALSRSATELLATGVIDQSLMRSFIATLTGQTTNSKAICNMRNLCQPSDNEEGDLRHFRDIADVGGEFLARHTRLLAYHYGEEHSGHQSISDDRFRRETSRLFSLETEFKQQVVALFEHYGMHETVADAERIEVFYNTPVGNRLFVAGQDRVDSLGRSTLQQWLDFTDRYPSEEDIISLKRNVPFFNLNRQDILGRTALHVACLYGWTNVAEILVDAGADPDLSTVFGHVPFHYAAVQTAGYTEKLCDLVATPYSVKKLDCNGKVGLAYAAACGNYKLLDIHTRLQK